MNRIRKPRSREQDLTRATGTRPATETTSLSHKLSPSHTLPHSLSPSHSLSHTQDSTRATGTRPATETSPTRGCPWVRAVISTPQTLIKPKVYTLNPKLHTPNPSIHTLNTLLYNLNTQLHTLNPILCTLDPKSYTLQGYLTYKKTNPPRTLP